MDCASGLQVIPENTKVIGYVTIGNKKLLVDESDVKDKDSENKYPVQLTQDTFVG